MSEEDSAPAERTYVHTPTFPRAKASAREAAVVAAAGLYLGMSGRRSARGDRFPSVCTKRALASVCE